jgi:hypothetical protein
MKRKQVVGIFIRIDLEQSLPLLNPLMFNLDYLLLSEYVAGNF